MPKLRLGLVLVGGFAAALAAGCGDAGSRGAPTKGPPQVSFLTADLSTGTRVASLQIFDGGGKVAEDVASRIAAAVRVATWPGDVEVATTETVTIASEDQSPNGAIQLGFAQIDRELDPAVDGNTWYAISLPDRPTEYSVPRAYLFAFDGGALGARLSPAHAPVVASVMSCAKEGGVVAVYARFSEPVTKADGALTLDYGAGSEPCAVGGDGPDETQFICPGTSGGQPFSLRIVGAISAAAAGTPVATGTLRSADMQAAVAVDGCSVHKPLMPQ